MEWAMIKSMRWKTTLANIVRNILVEVSIAVTMNSAVNQEDLVMQATNMIFNLELKQREMET